MLKRKDIDTGLHATGLPKLQLGDLVLVCKGLPQFASQFKRPFQVTKTAVQQTSQDLVVHWTQQHDENGIYYQCF